MRLLTCSPPPPWAHFSHSPPFSFSPTLVVFLLFLEHAKLITASGPWTHCPSAWNTPPLNICLADSHFIQVFDQMSHPQRGLCWLICMKRTFLILQSLNLLSRHSTSHFLLAHYTSVCLLSVIVLECKCHEDKDSLIVFTFISLMPKMMPGRG